MDKAELKMAVQHRYVLARFNDGGALISTLREANCEAIQEAEAAVT